MKFFWSGKTALITGGNCSIALSLAKLLMESSITPYLTYRSEESRALIEETLGNNSDNYFTVNLDYSDPATLDNIDLLNQNAFDYLVDFAQGDFESLVASADDDKIDAFIDESIGFRAKLLKKITRNMLPKKNGRLLFISSTAAKMPNKGQGFYSAVKLAGEALYKNIGLELGGKGITTMSLRPGYVNSGRGEKYILKNKNEVFNKIPVGMALTSSEIAETIMFFLSDSARGFNATEIVMDGGLTSGK